MKKFLKAISLLFFMSSVVAGFNYLIISNNESVAKAKEEYINKVGEDFQGIMASNYSYLMSKIKENEVTDKDDRFSLATKRAMIINIGEEAKVKAVADNEKAKSLVSYYSQVRDSIESKLALLNAEFDSKESLTTEAAVNNQNSESTR